MNKLKEKREQIVVKSNALIQKTRYDLSLQEQKIVLRLIQMIEPNDTEFKLYEFSIKEFCEFCGISSGGKNYIDIKNTIKSLADKSCWIELDNGKETLFRWIDRPFIDKKSGVIQVKIDDIMKPYLLKLKSYFTTYPFYYIIVMKSKYSIRLYELLKSYQNLKEYTFDVEKLKSKLMADTYDRWADFKRYAIDPAIREINLYTDISISYTTQKNGRQISDITFEIEQKDVRERLKAFSEIEKKLNSKQMKLLLNEVTETINEE